MSPCRPLNTDPYHSACAIHHEVDQRPLREVSNFQLLQESTESSVQNIVIGNDFLNSYLWDSSEGTLKLANGIMSHEKNPAKHREQTREWQALLAVHVKTETT